MPSHDNPFLSAYMTEIATPTQYVNLFSPVLTPHTQELFKPGNVILVGDQGSGKSMLLALLQPEIRLEYCRLGVPFPVTGLNARFIGAGINLTRSAAIDFGQRMHNGTNDLTPRDLVMYFGDFINYWIANDLLDSLYLLSQDPVISHEIQLNYDPARLDSFASDVSVKRCWGGALSRIHDINSLKQAFRARIEMYLHFLRGDRPLADSVRATLTSPGEPVSQIVKSLHKNHLVDRSCHIFVRIDQYEEMVRLEAKGREMQIHIDFRAIVNRMIGTRDPSISYRIGARKYAYRKQDDQRMYGTAAAIEDMRNYSIIDLDERLRRKENTKHWIFPKLAEDVFRRRLMASGYKIPPSIPDCLCHVLGGSSMTVKEKISRYTGHSSRELVKGDGDWPSEMKAFARQASAISPLDAKLSEAWIRQQLRRSSPKLPRIDYLPWNSLGKRWWRKERMFLASLQIAACCAQKLLWARKKDVIDLSGGNILVFVEMCQRIWASWLRSLGDNVDCTNEALPVIDDPLLQSEGIDEASDRWYEKITEEQGGHLRRRLVAFLGLLFRNELRSDKSMSYPGHNGISLVQDELEGDAALENMLRTASAYGVLVDFRHTPKTRQRGESRKWYLHPSFSPHFQIPANHTKEPMYMSARALRDWLEKAKVLEPLPRITDGE